MSSIWQASWMEGVDDPLESCYTTFHWVEPMLDLLTLPHTDLGPASLVCFRTSELTNSLPTGLSKLVTTFQTS